VWKKVIGDLVFAGTENGVTIEAVTDPDCSLNIPTSDLDSVIDFLISLDQPAYNKRQFFRVPIQDSYGVKVEVHVGGQIMPAIAKNVSVTGILVQLDPDDAVRLRVGSKLHVVIEFEDEIINVDAVVKRHENHDFGLFFPKSMTSEHVQPAPALNRLIVRLQRLILARRK